MLYRAWAWTYRWGRRLAISVLAAPLVNLELVTMWAPDSPLARLGAVTCYALVVWAVIIASAGYKSFISYISVASIMFVATAVMGSAAQRAIESITGVPWSQSSGGYSADERSVGLVIMLMTSIPLALFLVQSFSVSSAIERVSRYAGTSNHISVKVAVCLRVLQHMGETFLSLVTIWREANPVIYSPRHRDDWVNQNIIGRALHFFSWLGVASQTWARGLLVLSLRIVPVIEVEISRITKKT